MSDNFLFYGLVAAVCTLLLLTLGLAWRLRMAAAHCQATVEENTQQKAILDTSDDAIVTITQDGLVRSFNKSAEKMFLWNEADILGKNINLLMPEPFKSAHDIYLQRYKLDGLNKRVISKTRELTGLRKDGTEFPISLTVQKVRRADPLLFVGYIHDLTETRDQHNHLAHTKRQYNTLLHGMPGVVWSILSGTRGQNLFVTDNIDALTGYPPENFRDNAIALNDLIVPQDLPKVMAAREGARLHAGEYTVALRLRTCRDTEESVWELGRVTAQTDGTTRIQGLWLKSSSPACRTWHTASTPDPVPVR